MCKTCFCYEIVKKSRRNYIMLIKWRPVYWPWFLCVGLSYMCPPAKHSLSIYKKENTCIGKLMWNRAHWFCSAGEGDCFSPFSSSSKDITVVILQQITHVFTHVCLFDQITVPIEIKHIHTHIFLYELPYIIPHTIWNLVFCTGFCGV